MAEAARQTRSTEAESSPEQRAARADTREVTNKLFAQKVPENPTAEDSRRIDADPAAQAIFTAQYCARVDEKTIREKNGIPLRDGNPAKVMGTEGGEGRLVEITGVDGDKLKCKYEVGEGDSTATFEESFTRGEIQNSILVSEKDAIVNGFSGEQQQVVKAQLDAFDRSVKPEDISQPDAETLKKAAESAGLEMISAEHAQTLIESMTLPQKNTQQVRDIAKRLEGRIFAGANDFSNLARVVGPDSGSLAERIGATQEDIASWQAEAAALDDTDPKKQELQGKVANAQKQESAFSMAHRTLLAEETAQAEAEETARLEAENSPLALVDKAIDNSIKEFQDRYIALAEEQKRLRELKEDLPESQVKEMEKLKSITNVLISSQGMDGAGAIFAKGAVMDMAIAYGQKDKTESSATKQLVMAREQNLPEAMTKARTDALQTLQNSGLEQEQITYAMEMFDSPDKYEQYLSQLTGKANEQMDPNMKALIENAGVKEALMGNTSREQLTDFLADMEAAIPEEHKAEWSKTKKALMGSALGISGVGILFLLLTGAAMVFVGKGIASDSRAA